MQRISRDKRAFQALVRGRAAGSTSIDTGAQLDAAAQQEMALKAISSSPAIRTAIAEGAKRHTVSGSRSDLTAAIDNALEIARREGEERANALKNIRRDSDTTDDPFSHDQSIRIRREKQLRGELPPDDYVRTPAETLRVMPTEKLNNWAQGMDKSSLPQGATREMIEAELEARRNAD